MTSIWVAVCLTVGLGVLVASGVGAGGATTFVVNTALVVVSFCAAAACGTAARQAIGRDRQVWGFIGLSCLVWSLGQVTWTLNESVLHGPSPPTLGIPAFAVAPILMCIGLLGLSTAPTTAIGRARAVLDGTMIAGALFIVSWITVLGEIVAAGSGTRFDQIASIYSPTADVVLVTVVLAVFLRIRQLGRRMPRSLVLVGAGIVALAVADSGYAYLTFRNAYQSGSLIDLAWLAGFASIGLAGIHRHLEGSDHDDAVDHRPLGQLLPYAALGAALVTTWVGFQHGTSRVTLAAWCVVISVMAVRQILAVRENVSLTRTLEARVSSRTAELEASERRFRALVHHSSDVVMVVDEAGFVTYQSESITPILGYEPLEILGRSVLALATLDAADELRAELEFAAHEALGTRSVEVDLRHATGRTRHVEMTVTNLIEDPAVAGLVLNIRDVSERRSLEERLMHDAFHDSLTGLPNRSLFLDRLRHALTRGYRAGAVAILFIDLDGFKTVNDTLGHAAGDRLLIDVAQLLQDGLRPGDTVARLGGDEFAILLEDAGGDFGAVAVAERTCERLRARLVVQGQDVFLRASVGIAIAEPGIDGDSLLRSADLAMYRAKSEGDGGFALYDPAMHETLVERVRLEGELRTAVDDGQLVIHYQPILRLDTGRLVGVEALLRWQHPVRGLIMPGTFIHLAEEAGLTQQICRFVVREACRQAGDWAATHPQLRGMSIAVNLSAPDVTDPGLAGFVAECLLETGLSPFQLVLEMTESMLIEHSVQTVEQLERLKALGVRLAIDDFGTGYSSLSYLHRFPVDILKIDRSFVERVTTARDAEFVRTIVSLGRSLGLITVAEGIESDEQLAALCLAGCELGQGFHFSRPVPADQVATWVDGRMHDADRHGERTA